MSKNIWNVVKVNVGRMIQEIGHSKHLKLKYHTKI